MSRRSWTGFFTWLAGQHISLRFRLDGAEHRRSYTISNPPGDAAAHHCETGAYGRWCRTISVMRLKRRAIWLEVMPPFGRFHAGSPGATARRTHYVFGAGSGITPLYAMIRDGAGARTLVGRPPDLRQCGSWTVSCFNEALDGLTSRAFPERFHSAPHILSAPSLWSWFTPWRKGRMNAEAVAAAIAGNPARSTGRALLDLWAGRHEYADVRSGA